MPWPLGISGNNEKGDAMKTQRQYNSAAIAERNKMRRERDAAIQLAVDAIQMCENLLQRIPEEVRLGEDYLKKVAQVGGLNKARAELQSHLG